MFYVVSRPSLPEENAHALGLLPTGGQASLHLLPALSGDFNRPSAPSDCSGLRENGCYRVNSLLIGAALFRFFEFGLGSKLLKYNGYGKLGGWSRASLLQTGNF